MKILFLAVSCLLFASLEKAKAQTYIAGTNTYISAKFTTDDVNAVLNNVANIKPASYLASADPVLDIAGKSYLHDSFYQNSATFQFSVDQREYESLTSVNLLNGSTHYFPRQIPLNVSTPVEPTQLATLSLLPSE